jgi:hypothetical protein
MESLRSYLPKKAKAMRIRFGSVEEGCEPAGLTAGERAFLENPKTSAEASVLKIRPDGIVVVGKGKWGMLYGVQSINQLAIQAAREKRNYLPCLTIRDWPDARWRCLSPQLAWYAGWGGRVEGFDCGNWTLDEWKWLADWSLLHKINAWAVCMYGKWPFTLPGYDEDTLDFDSYYYDRKTGRKTSYRYTHRNIKREFLPELICYANARGVAVHAYIGKNSYNGTYIQRHPEADAQSSAKEAIPFTPGVHEYWDAFIRRILELGFNGFVFEDPETYHVPNQNEQCYRTFWEPWAKTYGFTSVAETDRNKPPLGVHLEYYAWLFREFDRIIEKRAKEFGRREPEIYLISHFLVDRLMKESKSEEEQARWLALLDEKQGRKVPFVLLEDNEKEYVRFLGADRVSTLGGRGGAHCGCFRIASINANRVHGCVGMNLAEDREAQQRTVEAGGFGGMAYTFQWTHTEAFGYAGAQYYWRHSGAPGIDNGDDFGFLDYAYRIYYGEEVGAVAAKAYGSSACVAEYQILEDGPQTFLDGGPLHRDFQLLAVMADEADRLSQEAYRLYTGRQPDLCHACHDPDAFRWEGYDAAADTMFKTERLRLLCVSSRRAQELCKAALASRVAKQRIAEGAAVGAVCEQFDIAVKAARTSELLYFANYDDHYTTGRAGSALREKLEAMRDKFLADCRGLEPSRPVPEAVRNGVQRRAVVAWEKQTDILPESSRADKPGLYLSIDLGLSNPMDYFCLGAVFTVQTRGKDGQWQTLFRRALLKKDAGWQRWDIPLGRIANERATVALRLTTDAYSRAIDRKHPTWKWGYWGQPQIVQVAASGKRQVRCDLIERVDNARAFVRLDSTGEERPFDAKGEDSTGATFLVENAGAPTPDEPAIAAFAPHRDGQSGVTVVAYIIELEDLAE